MTRFGDYELERKLGAGGMGEVFLARRVSDAGQVVIKRLLPSLTARADLVDRFLDEVRVLARLHHPGVVRVFDFGQVAGEWFLAMEFVDGSPLNSVLPLPVGEAVRVVVAIARALHAAHTLRDSSGRPTPIVHRDVSPHNVLVARGGDVKLIDFGIASLAGAGMGGGKLRYAAPEQLLEEVTSPASDQYSLGVVLWEALAGRAAFDGEDVEVMRLVTEEGVPALTGSGAELTEIVTRMTALKSAHRFPSLNDVAEALLPFAAARSSAPSPITRTSSSESAPRAPSVPLTAVEAAALAALRDGMTAEEAEQALEAAALDGAPLALDVLQDLVEKGALRAEDRDGVRRFRR